MTMLKRLGRLFTIRTRWEAWAVIWAITLGAVERGKAYLATYPGTTGWLFFAACVAVVFIAGPKLLDATRSAPQSEPARIKPAAPARRYRGASVRSRSPRRPNTAPARPTFHRT